MKIFNRDFQEIPFSEMPDAGECIVCHDPQKRLGKITWGVLISTEGMASSDSAKGLFWDKDDAVLFAKALEEANNET